MSTMPDRTRNNVANEDPAMASKLVTERGFRRAPVWSSATNPHHHVRDGPLRFDWYKSILSMFRGSWIAPPRKSAAGAVRGDPK
jgi:hypothetical protein